MDQMWKTTITTINESVVNFRDVRLSVLSHPDGRQWQHVLFSFGRHAASDHEACLARWPQEALRLAREQLDRFEAQLGATDE